MSIKSDRWIRRMAAEHGMIEPFSAQQVRVSDGHKIVSYGTSSYGYDVRCAEDFKIFTNINSTIVDPKKFDEKSFVDFKGPVCIIPPNSFALASTVEYFRIPRSVLTVCLGKCVTGDTRVVDADTGAYVPITEMRWGKSTLALDNRRLKAAKVSAFVPQGKKEVFELRTRAGLRIRATANHPFLKLKGWVPLSDLRPGDRIAAARDIPVFGKTPIPDGEASSLGLTISELVPQCVFTAPESSARLFLQSLFNADGSVYSSKAGTFLEYCSKSRRLIEDVHHLLLRFGVFSLIREEATAIGTRACKIQITDKDQIRRFAERIGFTPGSLKQRRLDIEVLPMIRAQPRHKSNFDSQHAEAWPMPAMATGDLHITPVLDGPMWDVVESIEPAGEEEVFDISVPTLHNFVANDLIVHNSTYARCFAGDTRVALVDGTSPTLEEMARRRNSGELFRGYSIGKNGRLIVSLLDAPRFIGRDSLLEVELDNGERIRATPDHLFMKRDGRMAAAHALRPNDALMPLYRDLFHGYEQVYQPIDGCLDATHALANEWNIRHKISADISGTHRQHLNLERLKVPRFPRFIKQFKAAPTYRNREAAAVYRNHKVVAVREIAGDHDVYCLTVPEAGNFALEAGVFVRNCGIIVNVTPLEPEWEGHVTLEFSNTTPLPAKIYANEGVAQMLFFESDEVCETSYKDRGGKYQGQRGVTLPKT
jgi:deoxycytidine triphosphate deaminase